MANDEYSRFLVEEIFEGRDKSPEAIVFADLPVFKRDVEIGSQNDAFPRDLGFFKGFEHRFPPV